MPRPDVKYKGHFLFHEWTSIGHQTPFFDTKAFEREMDRALRKELIRESEIVQRAFERTVSTWNTEVNFYIDYNIRRDDFEFTVWTDNEIYSFVNDGTSIRFATMPPTYRPKSQVRVIGSRQGGGDYLFLSKHNPRPGIQAREYVDEIFERRKDYFYNNMYRIVDRIFDRYWRQGEGRRR